VTDFCGATGQDLLKVAVTPSEAALVQTVSNMLADAEWLLPIVAAQPQYRGTYYPLTAAALLEDLWFDALANWVARAEPTTTMEKTPRGLPGAQGDYIFAGSPYSHKSGNGPQTTGVHWDALVAAKTGAGLWSSLVPLVYVGTGYGNLTGEWVPGLTAQPAGRRNSQSVWPRRDPPPAGRVPALLRWEPSGEAEVLAVWDAWPTFENVWAVVAEATAAGTPANHLEMLWVASRRGPAAGDTGRLVWTGRPGFFVFPVALLTDVPTGGNNRATTMEQATILALMASAQRLGLWTPMPMWHAAFAPPRPPDLYLAQRSDFDRRFSPAARP
jgi:hypothetical protein